MRQEALLLTIAAAVSLLILTRQSQVFVPQTSGSDAATSNDRRLKALELNFRAIRTDFGALSRMYAASSERRRTEAASAVSASSPPPPPTAAAAVSSLAAADSSCNPRLHAGYGGGSLGWGMSFKVETAQECCDACRAHAATCTGNTTARGAVYYRRKWNHTVTDERCAATMSSNEEGTHAAQPCNVFVFCPTPVSEGGLCWSNDVWDHRYGECWLKHQPKPHAPWAGAYGAYPDGYRKKHKTTPPLVQWMSGSLTQGGAPVKIDGPHWHW